MSSLYNRLEKLEQQHGPAERILTVIYDYDNRIATDKSSPELIGKSREEIDSMIAADKKNIFLVLIYIPDNKRPDNQ
jgi:hypothetical protein